MTEELSIDEFMQLVEPELERQVDEQILAEPDPEARLAMMRCRKSIVSHARTATLIANLRHRLAEAEDRLRPRLVERA